jgi:hypothetical protein
MPDLLPGSTIAVRMPSVPRVQVEQPAGASTSVYVPTASWRSDLAALEARFTDIEDSLDTWLPGTELANVERVTAATATATSIGAAVDIPGLVTPVVTGRGRVVEVKFDCASVRHSVANTIVTVALYVNGVAIQAGGAAAPLTTNGVALHFERRVLLTDGASYSFHARAYAFGVAGTSSLDANSTQPISLGVIAR